MNKKERNEALKRDMLETIKNGGCWFCTRRNHFVKIARDEVEGLLFARECHFKEEGKEKGVEEVMEGGAYTFGMDWFDISIRGKSIDIYADAESFQSWDVWYDKEQGTCHKTREDGKEPSQRLVKFCAQADKEALQGIPRYYTIDSTNFSKIEENGA